MKMRTQEQTDVQRTTYFAFNRVAFAMDDGVGSHDAIWLWFGADDFKFDGSHAPADDESVVLVNGAVSLQEIRLQVHVKEVAVITK